MWEFYGQAYTMNDQIIIELNLKEKSLCFYLNGKSQGLAYYLPNGIYYFAACFANKNEGIKMESQHIFYRISQEEVSQIVQFWRRARRKYASKELHFPSDLNVVLWRFCL